MSKEPWEIAYTTAYETEAFLLKGFLEHNGIECVIDDPAPFHVGESTEIHLMVAADNVNDAKALIEQRQEKSIVCSDCGAAGDEGDNFCRNCGASFNEEDEEDE